MANVSGGMITTNVLGGTVRYTTLSGTVKIATAGVARTIRVYRNENPDISFSTISDAAGNWSIDVIGNSNNTFTVIALGAEGENSEIFDHVVGF